MKKPVLITICLVLVLAVLFTTVNFRQATPPKTQAELPNKIQITASKQQISETETKPEIEIEATARAATESQKSVDLDSFTDLEIEEIYQWLESQGLFFSDKELYETYDLATLEELAQQGDQIALYLLPSRYSKLHYESKGKSDLFLRKRDEALRNAAIRGSSYAIEKIANELTRRASHEFWGPEEIRRDMMKEGIAYLIVAEIRGWGLAAAERSRLESELEEPWSTEEQLEIETMAQATYEEFEQEREKLGLDPFDNSIPELVEQYYSTLIQGRDQTTQ